jgi:hypothetical protein
MGLFLEWMDKRINEGVAPWLLLAKWEKAIELLKNSKYFKGRPVSLKSLNLSRGQIQDIFGLELDTLMRLGIVVPIKGDGNPFGGSTTSYTLKIPDELKAGAPNEPAKAAGPAGPEPATGPASPTGPAPSRLNQRHPAIPAPPPPPKRSARP